MSSTRQIIRLERLLHISIRQQYNGSLHINTRAFHARPVIYPSLHQAVSVKSFIRCQSTETKQKDAQGRDRTDELSDHDKRILAAQHEKQREAPWHREGVDESPVRKQRSAGAMTKGEQIILF